MKLIFAALTALSVSLALTACQESQTTTSKEDPHAGHDHAGHDHDHAGHDHSGHDHEPHEVRPEGPNGGRVITSFTPKVELLVRDDRHVQVSILNDDLEPIEAGTQNIKLTGGKRSAPFQMIFDKEGKVFVSLTPLPQGQNLPSIFTVDGQTEKFNLNLNDCPSCDFLEYACTCDH